jgi:hypothetical protein
VGTAFSWSISRQDAFQSCRRRYYHAYHAAAEDPEIKRLKRLSALPCGRDRSCTRRSRISEDEGRRALPTEEEAIVRAAVHDRMKGDWHRSEEGSPALRLFEHEYGVPVEQEDERIAVGIVMRSLRHVFVIDPRHETVLRRVLGAATAPQLDALLDEVYASWKTGAPGPAPQGGRRA